MLLLNNQPQQPAMAGLVRHGSAALLAAACLTLALAACGGGDDAAATKPTPDPTPPPAANNDLSKPGMVRLDLAHSDDCWQDKLDKDPDYLVKTAGFTRGWPPFSLTAKFMDEKYWDEVDPEPSPRSNRQFYQIVLRGDPIARNDDKQAYENRFSYSNFNEDPGVYLERPYLLLRFTPVFAKELPYRPDTKTRRYGKQTIRGRKWSAGNYIITVRAFDMVDINYADMKLKPNGLGKAPDSSLLFNSEVTLPPGNWARRVSGIDLASLPALAKLRQEYTKKGLMLECFNTQDPEESKFQGVECLVETAKDNYSMVLVNPAYDADYKIVDASFATAFRAALAENLKEAPVYHQPQWRIFKKGHYYLNFGLNDGMGGKEEPRVRELNRNCDPVESYRTGRLVKASNTQ